MWGAEGWATPSDSCAPPVTAVTRERGPEQGGEGHVLLHFLPCCRELCQAYVCSRKGENGKTHLCWDIIVTWDFITLSLKVTFS